MHISNDNTSLFVEPTGRCQHNTYEFANGSCYCEANFKWYRGLQCEFRDCGKYGTISGDDCHCSNNFQGTNCERMDCNWENTNTTVNEFVIGTGYHHPTRILQTECICLDGHWGVKCNEPNFDALAAYIVIAVFLLIFVGPIIAIYSYYYCCKGQGHLLTSKIRRQRSTLGNAVYRTDSLSKAQSVSTSVGYIPVPTTQPGELPAVLMNYNHYALGVAISPRPVVEPVPHNKRDVESMFLVPDDGPGPSDGSLAQPTAPPEPPPTYEDTMSRSRL